MAARIQANVLRAQALSLYRASLASASKCPGGHHAAEMKAYVRLKFREGTGMLDQARARHALHEGIDELATMEFYHLLRESRAAGVPSPSREATLSSVKEAFSASTAARIAATAKTPSPRVPAPAASAGVATSTQTAAFCGNCGAAYGAGHRFCTQCGLRRA